MYFYVCFFMTNVTLLFNWMGQGWDWIEKWRKAHRFLQSGVCARVCVCVSWGVAGRPGWRDTLLSANIWSAASLWPTSAGFDWAQLPRVHQGVSSLRWSARRKSWSVGCGSCHSSHPTPFIPSHTTGEGKLCHERSPPSRDWEAKSTIPPVFFHSNLF